MPRKGKYDPPLKTCLPQCENQNIANAQDEPNGANQMEQSQYLPLTHYRFYVVLNLPSVGQDTKLEKLISPHDHEIQDDHI